MKENARKVNSSEYRWLVDLRFLVGFLGEKEQSNWWDTSFLSATGLRFSAINFPRSAFAAAGVSVTEAARRLHDARIGKGGVFHLFRLPPVIEEVVHHEMLHGDNGPVILQIADKQTALGALKSLAKEPDKTPAGPVQIGVTKTILQARSLEKLAGYYLDAFRNDRKTFPYFMDEAG